jgi:glycosyltransferase involved in cell wall biosynthesis
MEISSGDLLKRSFFDGHGLTVAHLTDAIDGRSNSGTARVASELITHLAKIPNISQVFIHFQETSHPIYSLPNTREIIIPLRKFPFAKHFFSFLVFWLPKFFNSKEQKFDVVHWHTSRVYPLFFLIPSKKVFVTLHDANIRIVKELNTFWTRIFFWNLRISIHWVDAIFGVSNDACNNLVQVAGFPGGKVRRLYLGSNFDSVIPVKPLNFDVPRGFYLCVSRWQPYKNVETLIDAYANLLKRDLSLPKLVLVGKPVAGHDAPEKRISDRCLGDSVVILSDLTDQELSYLYRNALVHVFPSLYEGFGLGVLEALKCDCPSIDHKYTSTSEISDSAGIHVNMRSSEEIATALESITRNTPRIESLRNEARKRAKEFTWEKSTSQLLDYYLAKDHLGAQ